MVVHRRCLRKELCDCIHVSLYRRAHEKKVCCLGLVALLQLPPASCPPEVLALQPDVIKVLLQLLVAYNEQEEGESRVRLCGYHTLWCDSWLARWLKAQRQAKSQEQ